MSNNQGEDAMLLEELEVVVGGLTRPWVGSWQSVDLDKGDTSPIDPDMNPLAPAAAADH
jgi:hypothetical protein